MRQPSGLGYVEVVPTTAPLLNPSRPELKVLVRRRFLVIRHGANRKYSQAISSRLNRLQKHSKARVLAATNADSVSLQVPGTRNNINVV